MSREIDAMVAEKVMGWTKAEPLDGRSRAWPPDCKIKMWPHGISIPPYSTDIASAWEVVERMGRWHGFDFIVRTTGGLYGKKEWEAGWYEDGFEGPESRAVADADTVPMAICLAALAAAGVEAL